jgi:hypothetical protein
MPDNTDIYWGSDYDPTAGRIAREDFLLMKGPFSIEEGYLHWVKGGRDVVVEYEGQEVLVPAPFSPKGITIEVFEKVFVQRAINQT